MIHQERHELEAQIIERAWQEPAFKAELISNPQAAVQRMFDAQLPPGLSITVLEETPTHLYLVLPCQPMLAPTELNEADLALVGGGRTYRPSKTQACAELDNNLECNRSSQGAPLRRTSC